MSSSLMADVKPLRWATIRGVPDELLVEIFDWCRLDDEYGWNHRYRWFNLLQVCRIWKDVILESPSRLNLRFLYNFANPITTMPSYLTQLPLIISHDCRSFLSPPGYKEKLLLALRHRDRLCSIFIDYWDYRNSNSQPELWIALDSAFPMLETLSLGETNNTGRALPLPHHFVAPHLRALHLRNIATLRECLSRANATNLSSLRLESIPDLTPGNLVDCIANMPQLEELLINLHIVDRFYPPTELPPTPFPRVVLARLSRLIFTGTGAYLGNLLTRISTPFLQDFRFMTWFRQDSRFPIFSEAVLPLTAFLGTVQNLKFRAAVVLFKPGVIAIAYHPSASASLPYFEFAIYYQMDDRVQSFNSMAQIWSAVAPALSVVESLTLQSHDKDDGRGAPWHALLQPFGGAKTLMVDLALTKELSEALSPDNGVVIEQLLPMLSKLVVVTWGEPVAQPFFSFIFARHLAGHSIASRVIRDHNSSLRPPTISWSFDTFVFRQDHWSIDHLF